MAQLKDTVVQGSLRVTDTAFTTNLNISSATASQIAKIDANKNLISGALTTSEIPSISITAGTTGTLPVERGGTGVTSLTANSIIMSGSSTAAAVTTRAVTNNTSNTAVVNNTNIPTMNTIYYGLVTVNNASQTRATGIYAPVSAGTANYILASSGGTAAPVWKRPQVYSGTCSTAAGTAAKEVICPEYDGSLTIGDMVIVKFDSTNSATAANLTLAIKPSSSGTATTAKNIKRQYNSTGANNLVAVGELNKDSIAVFVYNGTYWILTNADYNNTYDVAQVYSSSGANRTAETAANGGIGMHGYTIQMMTKNLTWSSLAATSGSTAANSGTATAKVPATASFLINSPIIYMSNNTYTAPGGNANVNGYTAISCDFRYNTSTGMNTQSLTIQKPVYLVGTPDTSGETFKLVSTNWWTQTLPTTDDGKIYIYLGQANSANNIYLFTSHPVFWFKDGKLRNYQSHDVSIGANITTNANYPVPFVTSNTATTTLKVEPLQKSGTKLFFNPSTGLLTSTLLKATSTAASTTTGSGALIVAGGAGIGGQLTATRVGAGGSNTSYTLYANGSTYLNGATTLNGNIIGAAANYGETLPTTGLTAGRLFFQTADIEYELPVGGDEGSFLIKYSSIDRDVTWSNTVASLIATTTITAGTNISAGGNLNISGNITAGGNISGSQVFNAVWTDYAECR